MKSFAKSFLAALAVLSVLAAAGYYLYEQEYRPAILEMHVFQLKSGVSILIRTPSDKRILIDGGSNSEVIRKITSVLPFYSRRIDVLLATRDSANQVGGLVEVLDRYTVSDVFIPGVTLNSLRLSTSTDPAYVGFLKQSTEKSIKPKELARGDILEWGDGVKTHVLFPVSSGLFKYSKASSPGLVLKMDYGMTSFYICFSSNKKIQKAMIKSGGLEGNPESALIVFDSANPANLDFGFVNSIRPKHLIYSKSITSKSPKKPEKNDPLYSVPIERRFNLKEKGTVLLSSDGRSIQAK